MTLEEAIKVNTRLAKELDIPQRAEESQAISLGIEALKRYKEACDNPGTINLSPLPGETEE